MNIEIRQCKKENVELLSAISEETFRDTFVHSTTPQDMDDFINSAYNVTQLQCEMETDGSYFYIAWHEKTPVGYLKINFGNAQKEEMGDNMMELGRLYVRPQFKRHGIGSKLMNFALQQARDAHVNGVWLGVWEHNEPAKAFYQKNGFKFVGSHTFSVGSDDQTDLLMSLSLK